MSTTPEETFASLPPEHRTAVQECSEYMRLHKPPPEGPPQERHYNPAQKQFLTKVATVVENRADTSLYTPSRYEAQLAHAKQLTDAFAESWQGALPTGGKEALKERFSAIVDMASVMETAWNPDIVNGSKERPHTGVFQTAWPFIHDAGAVYDRHPAMRQKLNADDTKIFALSKEAVALEARYAGSSAPQGLPSTSFAGQGAAFAAGAVGSYESFLKGGGRPDDFGGPLVYENHMLGLKDARSFRSQLATSPDHGRPGIQERTYNQNFLLIGHPKAPANDYNPGRIVFDDATPGDVSRILHDRYVWARNKMAAALGETDPRVLAVEKAFLPDWSDEAKKTADIARIRQQQEEGSALRASPEAASDPCLVLKPMSSYKMQKEGGKTF